MKKIDEKYFLYPEGKKEQEEQGIHVTLEPGESILWKGKPNKKCFIWSAFLRLLPFALLWLLFDGFALGMIFGFMQGIPWFVYFIFVIFFLFHLIPVWAWIASIFSAKKRQEIEEYAFTETRIFIRKGFIGSSTVSVPYVSLTSLNLRIGLLEKIFHVGDIYIVAGKEKYVLEDLEHPEFLFSRLQEISHQVKTDILYPNAYRPKENPGYHVTLMDNSKESSGSESSSCNKEE